MYSMSVSVFLTLCTVVSSVERADFTVCMCNSICSSSVGRVEVMYIMGCKLVLLLLVTVLQVTRCLCLLLFQVAVKIIPKSKVFSWSKVGRKLLCSILLVCVSMYVYSGYYHNNMGVVVDDLINHHILRLPAKT